MVSTNPSNSFAIPYLSVASCDSVYPGKLTADFCLFCLGNTETLEFGGSLQPSGRRVRLDQLKVPERNNEKTLDFLGKSCTRSPNILLTFNSVGYS